MWINNQIQFDTQSFEATTQALKKTIARSQKDAPSTSHPLSRTQIVSTKRRYLTNFFVKKYF